MHTHANDIRTISAHHIDRHVYSIYDSIEWDLFISSRAIFLFSYFFFVVVDVVVVGFDCRRTYSNSPWTSSSIRFLYSIGNCRPPERYKRHKQTYHTYERTATRREWRRPLNMFSSNNNCVPLELHFFFVRLLELASSLLVKWTNDMIVAHYHKWRIMVLEG